MKVHGSVSLQLLTCLLVYVTDVHSIMVKFGTRSGPIVPPQRIATRTPPIVQRKFFVPAPVWENREDDTPDPNVSWRPPLFNPYLPERHTQVIIPKTFSTTTQTSQSYAQKIANSYKAINVQEPYILSSQFVPGVGVSYFIPAFAEVPPKTIISEKIPNEDETNENDIETPQPTQQQNIYHWHSEKTVAVPTLHNFVYDKQSSPKYQYVPPPYVSRKNFMKPKTYRPSQQK